MSNSFLSQVHSYLESRIGYRLFLGGTRHFRHYECEQSAPWQIKTALRRMEAKLLAALKCKQGERVLDAGCGVGHVAIYVAREGGFKIDAIDVTPHHVVKAKRNIVAAGLQQQITAQEADYHDLKVFKDNTFDGLYTMETFVHARESLHVLQEFFRILKPGGRIALNEYDHEPPDKDNTDFIRQLTILNEVTGMPGFQSFRTGDIKRLLETAGFVNVEEEDLSKNIIPMLWLFYIFAVVPYVIFSVLGLKWRFPNTVAGAMGYSARKHTRYLQLSGTKPLSCTTGTRSFRASIDATKSGGDS